MFAKSFFSQRSIRVLGASCVVALCLLPVTIRSISSAQSAQSDNGQMIFRFDTFGDEQFWTDVLMMNQVIQSSVSPAVALSVGLKVDSTVLPPDFLATHSLTDPATTVELIRLNAVVGIVGAVRGKKLKSVGTTAQFVIRRWTTPSRRGLESALTPGPTAISIQAPSSRYPPRFQPRRRRCTTHGDPAATIHGSTSTASMARYSLRRRTVYGASDSKRIRATARSPTGTIMLLSRRWAGTAASAIRASMSALRRNPIS